MSQPSLSGSQQSKVADALWEGRMTYFISSVNDRETGQWMDVSKLMDVSKPMYANEGSAFLWACYATLQCRMSSSLKRHGYLASLVSEKACVSLWPPWLVADMWWEELAGGWGTGRWPNCTENGKGIGVGGCLFYILLSFFLKKNPKQTKKPREN